MWSRSQSQAPIEEVEGQPLSSTYMIILIMEHDGKEYEILHNLETQYTSEAHNSKADTVKFTNRMTEYTNKYP